MVTDANQKESHEDQMDTSSNTILVKTRKPRIPLFGWVIIMVYIAITFYFLHHYYGQTWWKSAPFKSDWHIIKDNASIFANKTFLLLQNVQGKAVIIPQKQGPSDEPHSFVKSSLPLLLPPSSSKENDDDDESKVNYYSQNIPYFQQQSKAPEKPMPANNSSNILMPIEKSIVEDSAEHPAPAAEEIMQPIKQTTKETIPSLQPPILSENPIKVIKVIKVIEHQSMKKETFEVPIMMVTPTQKRPQIQPEIEPNQQIEPLPVQKLPKHVPMVKPSQPVALETLPYVAEIPPVEEKKTHFPEQTSSQGKPVLEQTNTFNTSNAEGWQKNKKSFSWNDEKKVTMPQSPWTQNSNYRQQNQPPYRPLPNQPPYPAQNQRYQGENQPANRSQPYPYSPLHDRERKQYQKYPQNNYQPPLPNYAPNQRR